MTIQQKGAVKNSYISDLQEGQQIDDVFVVSRANLLETKAGKPYLALALMDKSGEIEARIWDQAQRFADHAVAGNFVHVQGQAKSFRESLQLTLGFLEQIPADTAPMEAFMPASPRPRAEMEAELDALIASFTDPGLRELLEKIFSGKTRELFCLAPAAKKMHHAYLHGLLEHTLSIAGLADKTASYYEALDRDLLLSGVLLHDLAKIKEFSFSAPPFDYTTQGRLLGHLMLGCEIVVKAAENVADLQRERLDQVLHLILSHHGQYDFGSPVLPMTRESLILHHLDDMDAKMQYCDKLVEGMEEDGWTDYQRPLERFLYLQASGEKKSSRSDESPPPQTNRDAPPVQENPAEKKSPQQRIGKQQRLF